MAEPWRGETYHGRPALKPAGFDWKVATYIAVLGTAGGAQVLAAVARRNDPGDRDGLARRARLLALAGSVIGPAVLVGHLKTPKRWYNMLRILRPDSPMSWGSWLLTGFGIASAATALGDVLGERWPRTKRLADVAQAPAAAAGAGMAVYTASLLSATSNPLWASAPAPLAAQFGAASMAGAAAALALLQRRAGEAGSARRLERFGNLALAAEFLAGEVAGSRWRQAGVAGPLEQGPLASQYRIGGKAVGLALPVAARAVGSPVLGSLAVLAGSALLRHALLRAGDVSSKRPHDYFGATQR
ncbi:NrfD/PsrC family molybdoenzyme membrane anchor subunit [Dankookia sp. GCM10030260]|uniref:NrfD/PsrC family molybdoenzyme membrane anchor subunit n=1 Tax=Dankookia sp. GCM10030260 TaxID=3273390 RepID=UPI00360F9B9B